MFQQIDQVAVKDNQIERHIDADESDFYALGGCRFEYERGGSTRNLKTTQ